jgi:hypothetical protein
LLGITTEEEADVFRRDLVDQFRTSVTEGKWVFSSEHMSSRLLTDGSLACLHDFLYSFFETVEIVLYVRRQDELAGSVHSTRIKDGSTRLFDIEQHIADHKRYDFRVLIERWYRAFSKGQTQVRLYPSWAQDSTALARDFVRTLGIDWSPDFRLPDAPINRALDSKALEFLRQINGLGSWPGGAVDRKVAEEIGKRLEGLRRGPPIRLSHREAAMIMRAFEDSNAWTLEQVVDHVEHSDYFAIRTELHDGTVNVHLEVEDYLYYAAALSLSSKDRLRLIEPG